MTGWAEIDEKTEETALIDAAKAGDTEAFGAIYRRYGSAVRNYISRRALNDALADDLAQEVWRKAWTNIHRYEHQGRNYGAFVTTIARNVIADHYKGAHSRLSVAVSSELLADRQDVDPWTDPERSAIHRQALSVLWAAVAELTPEQRECFELRHARGMSITEVAEAMGKQEGAVKALLHRVRNALLRNPAVREAVR